MTAFLRLFEAKALASALTEAGHSVSERTVQRWKAGITKPKPQDLVAIRRLLETTKEAHPGEPEWAGRMSARIVEELQLNRLLIESVLPPERIDEARELIASFEEQLRMRGADPPEKTGRSDPGEESPQAQADESPRVLDGGH